MYMQFNLDFNDNDNENAGRFDFAKEAERIQEENSTKEAELFLGKFESEDFYIKERKKVADQYKTFPDRIEFRDGEWYMKDSSLTVEDWDRTQDTSDFDYKSGHK